MKLSAKPWRFTLLLLAYVAAPLLLLGTSRTDTHAAQLMWKSGFELGFPGDEWLAASNNGFVQTSQVPTGRTSAWTIVSRSSGEPVYAGDHAYKGWIEKSSASSHRPYPLILTDIPTPLINTFMVYLDVDYEKMTPLQWIHFGTWGNYDQNTRSGTWALHTMGIRNRKLEFAHTTPFHGRYVGEGVQAEFPVKRWVKFTIYLEYRGESGFAHVWQDGKPILQAEISLLAETPDTRLRTAHWGMYASNTLDHGVQYNDEIYICSLQQPIQHFLVEPMCPSNEDQDIE